jgi:hypothetical protein
VFDSYDTSNQDGDDQMSEDCHDSNNRHVNDWAPKRMRAVKERLTAEQINSLPDFAREWIHDLATNADPAGTLAELRLLQDAFKAQEILITELRGEIENLLKLVHVSVQVGVGPLVAMRRMQEL